MPTRGDGLFSYEIPTQDLAKGLRVSRRSPRNVKFLTTCEGAVGRDGVLQVIDDINLDLIDFSATITDGFPYPQIFVFTNLIIVCSETKIYEYAGGSLSTAKITVAAGLMWSAVDFVEFIYMSNGKVAIKRSATSGVWAVDATLPIATGICNFNGQVIVGSPDVEWT
jgi:hypothetical protein